MAAATMESIEANTGLLCLFVKPYFVLVFKISLRIIKCTNYCVLKFTCISVLQQRLYMEFWISWDHKGKAAWKESAIWKPLEALIVLCGKALSLPPPHPRASLSQKNVLSKYKATIKKQAVASRPTTRQKGTNFAIGKIYTLGKIQCSFVILNQYALEGLGREVDWKATWREVEGNGGDSYTWSFLLRQNNCRGKD